MSNEEKIKKMLLDDIMAIFAPEPEEIVEIKKLYREVLSNYAELNKMFGLENPIDINELFYQLYTNGFLSYNKKFEFNTGNFDLIDNFKYVYGSAIIKGKGCCRHIASYLNDVYRYMGIISDYYPVKSPTDYSLQVDDSKDGSMQSLRDKIRLSYYYIKDDKITEFWNENGDKYLYVENIYNGNGIAHAITAAVYEGKSYIFDPEIGEYFKKVNDELISKPGIKYLSNLNSIYNDRLGETLALDSPSYEYINSRIAKMDKIIMSNIDVFNKFYNENKNLYEELFKKICDPTYPPELPQKEDSSWMKIK